MRNSVTQEDDGVEVDVGDQREERASLFVITLWHGILMNISYTEKWRNIIVPTFGSTGVYRRGTKSGVITAVKPSNAILTQSKTPSLSSFGAS